MELEGLSGQAVVDHEADLEVIIETMFAQVPPFRPEAELETVIAALQLLTQAQRPVIVAGGGLHEPSRKSYHPWPAMLGMTCIFQSRKLVRSRRIVMVLW